VRVGSTFALPVLITGDGNLERLPPLAAPKLDGFHVQGVAETKVDRGRRFVLELVPLRADLTAVPAIPLVVFDPVAGAYATVRSQPVALALQPGASSESLPPWAQELVDAEAKRLAAARRWPAWAWGLMVGTALTLAFGLRRRAWRSQRRSRLQLAIAEVERADSAALAAVHFDNALAAAADLPTWPGAPGYERLLARGVGADATSALQQLRQQVDAARFGGEAPPWTLVAAALRTLLGH
jgi:hypothetical protein